MAEKRTRNVDPQVASLRAKLAAHVSWANTSDRTRRTQAARDGRWRKLLDRARELHPQLDPDSDEITQVARSLQREQMSRAALKSAMSRRARKVPA